MQMTNRLDFLKLAASGGPQCKSVSAIAVHLPQSIYKEMASLPAVRLVTERGIGNVCYHPRRTR